MKRFGAGLLAAGALLTAALLFADVHAAYTSDHTDSQQSLGTIKAGPARVGSELRVYVGADRTLSGALRQQLAQALQAKELAFDRVRFVDVVPTDANQNPFLAILVEQDGGLWTPLFGTRHVKASIRYARGRAVKRDRVLAPAPDGIGVASAGGSCTGECAEGQRTVALNATATGLISLPHLRAYAAGKLAQEATTLVADGLPAHRNPAKWSQRASDLASDKLGAQP